MGRRRTNGTGSRATGAGLPTFLTSQAIHSPHWLGVKTNDTAATAAVAPSEIVSGRHSKPRQVPHKAQTREHLGQQAGSQPQRVAAHRHDDTRRDQELHVAAEELPGLRPARVAAVAQRDAAMPAATKRPGPATQHVGQRYPEGGSSTDDKDLPAERVEDRDDLGQRRWVDVVRTPALRVEVGRGRRSSRSRRRPEVGTGPWPWNRPHRKPRRRRQVDRWRICAGHVDFVATGPGQAGR